MQYDIAEYFAMNTHNNSSDISIIDAQDAIENTKIASCPKNDRSIFIRIENKSKDYIFNVDINGNTSYIEQSINKVIEIQRENFIIIIDHKAFFGLFGLTLSYEKTESSEVINFINLNKKYSCGCGKSFSN